MLAHFNGETPWYSIEDLVNKQSGVLVGKSNIAIPFIPIAI